MTPFRKSLVFLFVLALVATACGDSEGDTTTTTAAPGTTAAATTQAPDTTAGATTTVAPDPGFEGKSVAAPNCDYGGKISSIEATAEYEVTFTMCSPVPAFRQIAAFTPFGIQPEEHLEATGGAPLDNPIGTGPWAFDAWNRGDSIVFSRNDSYWGDAASYSQLVFRWASEGASRLLELQSGTVDQITNISPDDFATVQNDPNLTFIPVANPNTLYLGNDAPIWIPSANPGGDTVFADVNVRRAIGMGIDRQRIVDNFYPEGSEVASHFTPCSIPNGCQGDAWVRLRRGGS